MTDSEFFRKLFSRDFKGARLTGLQPLRLHGLMQTS